MKFSNLTQAVSTAAIALSVAAFSVALPVSAQTTTSPDASTGTTAEVDTEDDGSSWGWLGLLGLAGLAGLRRKPQETTEYRTTPARSDVR